MSVPASNIRPVSEELPVNANFVKQNFLFGVNLKDDDGNTMPDSVIDFYIAAATKWLERELDILLFPATIEDERHDYVYNDYIQYGFVKLFHYPVRAVSRVAMSFPLSTEVLVFDPEWYRTESVSGQVNLIPTSGTLSAILMGQGGSFLPLVYSGTDYIPHVITVDYEAGYPEDGIPADLLNLIGMKASIGPLNIAGDLIAGAGIANKSISLDGLSESIGTTSSATNAGYGARILQYEKQIKDTLATIRRNLKGIQMVVA